MMPLGLCTNCSFCLAWLLPLGSLECSSSLFKISNITSLLSLPHSHPLPLPHSPGPSSVPIVPWILPSASSPSTPVKPPRDPIPRGDPVSLSLAESPPIGPQHPQAES